MNREPTRTFVDGVVWVQRRRCKTCIFGPNSPVTQERADEVIAGADLENSCIPCHSILYEDAPIEPVCRGYFDRKSSMLLCAWLKAWT